MLRAWLIMKHYQRLITVVKLKLQYVATIQHKPSKKRLLFTTEKHIPPEKRNEDDSLRQSCDDCLSSVWSTVVMRILIRHYRQAVICRINIICSLCLVYSYVSVIWGLANLALFVQGCIASIC